MSTTRPRATRGDGVIPGPLELVLTAILFGAIGAFSPTRLALSVVMLTSETRPWGRAIAYLIGSTAIFATAAIIGLLGVQAAGLRGADPKVNIVLGTIMIGAAISMVVGQRRRGTSLRSHRPARCSPPPASVPGSRSSRSGGSS